MERNLDQNPESNLKKETRKAILKARQSLSPQEVSEKSSLITAFIRETDSFKNARTVMAYLPFRNEVDTTSIFSELWRAEKNVLVPVCRPEDHVLIPCRIQGMADLAPGTWGILEPKQACRQPVPADDIDLVIVPGVAFDPECNRLGYGGGYYDRFLPRLKPGTPKVAVAFQMQILTRLIPGEYDRPMDLVITEENRYSR